MNPATLTMAGGGIFRALQSLYGTATNINDFLNEQISVMKEDINPTISRTGEVLEKAKLGFGIGFATPVVVIATGQLILGNPLSAAAVVATAPVNPLAMTCAAVGAVYYGWNVLSEKEKDEILSKLSHGLEIGIEMIKSVIRFVIEISKELWSSEYLVEIRKYISEAAGKFGKKLGDITGTFTDKAIDAFETTIEITSEFSGKAKETVTSTVDKAVGKFKELTSSKNADASKMLPESLVTELMVKVNDEGKLTIPADYLGGLDITPGSEVRIIAEAGKIKLVKAAS
jgi:hypothetical protein